MTRAGAAKAAKERLLRMKELEEERLKEAEEERKRLERRQRLTGLQGKETALSTIRRQYGERKARHFRSITARKSTKSEGANKDESKEQGGGTKAETDETSKLFMDIRK